MAKQYIKIRGANEHNLKNISIDIPRNELVVLTGLSGSGKSSLAFDTIYAEGQRRYMESLSSYARQFLGQMEKPDVESIEGLSPAISIDQKSTNRNPRSTVGTVTEIYDYMRLLYARIGIPHCPKCGREIRRQTVDQMVDQIMELPERTKIQLLAPVVRGRKGRHEKVLEQAKKSGYVRVRVDGSLYELSEEITLDKNIKHNIEIVVDRLVVKPGIEKRLSDSIETVMGLSNGLMLADTAVRDENGEEKHDTLTFSQNFSCPDCGISVDEVEPRSFSFNNPFGACPDCFGLGYKMEFDEDLMIPDKSLSINQGAITAMGWQSCTDKTSFSGAILNALAKEYDFSLDTPFEDYPKEIHDILIYGTGGKVVKVYYRGQRGEGIYDIAFEGLIQSMNRKYRETFSDSMKAEYETDHTVSNLQGAAVKKRISGGHGRREKYFRGDRYVDRQIPRIYRCVGVDADAAGDWCTDFERNSGENQLSYQCRSGISFPVACDWHAVRRRGAANPPGNPDRIRSGRCGIYSGRAEYRTSPAGQRQASRYPETPAGSGKFSSGG